MSNISNLDLIQSTEEARKRGSAGGKASGVARRKKRDAKESARLFLQLAAAGKLDQYLEELGVHERDRTNLMAIMARHTLSAQSGNVGSARLVLETAGYLNDKTIDNNVSVNIGKDDDNVVIVVPDGGRIEKSADM